MSASDIERELSLGELRGYLEGAPDGVLLVDADGRIRFANAVAHDLLDDGRGLVGNEIGLPLGDDSPQEIELRTRSGEFRSAEMRIRRVRTLESDGWVVALRDVTGRAEAARALLEAIQQRDDALAIASHELRNPLTALGVASQALSDQWEELPAIRRLELLRRINRATYRIASTVDQVLDATRLDAGLFKPRRRDTYLFDLLVEQFSAFAEQVDDLVLDIGEDVVVGVDPGHVWTMLSNLLTNCVKFAPGRVVISARPDGGWVEVAVADEGPGVPASLREALFERYRRLETNEAPGTGLGLWIARSVAEAYGGSLRCEANEPRGARFVLTLPAGSPPELAPESEDPLSSFGVPPTT